MTTIYFARHGQPDNPKGLIKGDLPGFPLDDLGRKQAEALGKKFSKRPIAAIYSSPLLRCRQTARIIKRYFPKLKVSYSKLVTEWRTKWAGKPGSDFAKSDFTEFVKHNEHPQQVARRMLKFCQLAKKRYSHQEIICVTHGGPIWALKRARENLSLDERPVDLLFPGEFYKVKC
ncbi:histidine phosphatase family protein [Candidatus Shapirobacteria bacterium]|nr:histidine phosphatase family protein [Candidatus Shapirobacteria bacterium]